jgi:hypothetical protein
MTKFRRASTANVGDLLDYMTTTLDTYLHAGVALRLLLNNYYRNHRKNPRAIQVQFRCREPLDWHNVRFDAIPYLEDLFVTLGLLRAGESNAARERAISTLAHSPSLARWSRLRVRGYL